MVDFCVTKGILVGHVEQNRASNFLTITIITISFNSTIELGVTEFDRRKRTTNISLATVEGMTEEIFRTVVQQTTWKLPNRLPKSSAKIVLKCPNFCLNTKKINSRLLESK